MVVLVVVWFVAALGGATAAALAFVFPTVRRPGLLVAGSAFAVAGILGILSIGIVFVGLAAVCFTKASKIGAAQSPPTT